MTLPSLEDSKDFFISYNQGDRAWAEWLAWTLEEVGYSVIIDAWDFRPGGNFALEMDRAMKRAERTIAVLSENYLNAVYTQSEWGVSRGWGSIIVWGTVDLEQSEQRKKDRR